MKTMTTSDFMIRSLFSIVSTPKNIIKRERISESSDKEIWRTSTYQLVTVEYDTIPKKTSWDTAHELPR